jgi:DNA-directed RNA polymerase subunit M/transcription elongation factor TFIIS
MPIFLICPQCNGKLHVADKLTGKTIKCPKCSAVFPASLAEGAAAITTQTPPPASSQGIKSTVPSDEELQEVEELEEMEEWEEALRVQRRNIRRDPANEAISTIIPYKNARALIAYYFGVFSFIPCLALLFGIWSGLAWKSPELFSFIPCLALLLGPAALVLGILGLRFVKANPTAKGTGHAIAGIVMGSLTTLMNLAAGILFL